MTATPSLGYLTELLEQMQQRITELETGQRLGNSSIIEGALIARDGAGVERARFGQLEDNTFGVTGRFVGGDVIGGNVSGATVTGGTVSGATVTGGTVTGTNINGAVVTGGTVKTQNLIVTDGSGNELPLTQLMSQKAGKNAAPLSMGVGGTLAANIWHYDTALNQSVVVTNGRLDITVTARLTVSNARGSLIAGFRITGPTSVPASWDDGLAQYWNGTGMDGITQASYRTLVTGLAAGTYTICPAYQLSSTGSPGAAGEVAARAIVVLPY